MNVVFDMNLMNQINVTNPTIILDQLNRKPTRGSMDKKELRRSNLHT